MSQPAEPDPVIERPAPDPNPDQASQFWRPAPGQELSPQPAAASPLHQSGPRYQAPPPPPPPAPRNARDVRRAAGNLIGPYLLPLIPVALLYSFVVTQLPESSTAYLVAIAGFWPLMLVLGFLLRLWRRARHGPPEPPRAPVWDRFRSEAPPDERPEPRA